MKVEQAKQIAETAIQQLAESLERGHSEELRRYLGAMAKFPKYSIHNLMLILSQRPDATHVAGYRTWQQLGRFVKKGAKGILISAPVVRHKHMSGEETEDTSAGKLVTFRGVYVFDQSDTDGSPISELSKCEGDPHDYTERLKQFVFARGVQLEYSDRICPAKGQCSPGMITLLPGLPPAEEFSTLAHETGHHLLHQSTRRAVTTKRVRETEAEAVAFVVCSAIGLEAARAASDYILLYTGDEALLAESLSHIQHASTEIISAIVSTG
jgi:hypothetical protein